MASSNTLDSGSVLHIEGCKLHEARPGVVLGIFQVRENPRVTVRPGKERFTFVQTNVAHYLKKFGKKSQWGSEIGTFSIWTFGRVDFEWLKKQIGIKILLA